MRRENRQIVGPECRLIDLRDFTLFRHDHRLYVRRRHLCCASFETDPRKQLEGLSRALTIDGVHFITNNRVTGPERDAAPRAIAQLYIGEAKVGELFHEFAMLAAESAKTGCENSDRDKQAFEKKIVVAIEIFIAVVAV